MTEHVPDQKRCQRLDELGMPQETLLSWYLIKEPHTNAHGHCYFVDKWELGLPRMLIKDHSWCAAPLATEMLKWLPSHLERDREWRHLELRKIYHTYHVGYDGTGLQVQENTAANALADLLIWCVEQGHVTF